MNQHARTRFTRTRFARTRFTRKTLILIDLLATKTIILTDLLDTKTLIPMDLLAWTRFARNTHADPGGSTSMSIKPGPTCRRYSQCCLERSACRNLSRPTWRSHPVHSKWTRRDRSARWTNPVREATAHPAGSTEVCGKASPTWRRPTQEPPTGWPKLRRMTCGCCMTCSRTCSSRPKI